MDSSIENRENRIVRRLRLRDLHVLATVVHWGSMAQAARHLALSQPAVSKIVADLENALRVRLLDRSPRGVEPTLYADALLKRGNVAFDELRQAIQEIEFLRNPTVGEVRISSPELLSAALLPAAMESLSRQHPRIVVRPFSAVGATQLEFRELRTRNVDLALARLTRAFTADDLDIEVLFDDLEVVVVGSRNRWARRRKLTLAQLANEPWIVPPNPVVSALIDEAFKAHDLAVPQQMLIAGSTLLRNQLLATGRYLSVLPSSVLRHQANQWALKALPVDLGIKPQS